MANINFSTLATQLNTNAAAVAAAAAGAVTTANIQALAAMLQIMADRKGLGLSPTLYLPTSQISELTPA